MEPLVSSYQLRKGHFLECLVEAKDGTLTDCVMCSDGQIYIFRISDISHLLAQYPQDKIGWFFNVSRDRYIAEKHNHNVSVNPSFVDAHFVARHY